MRTVVLLRRKLGGPGGAERVFTKYQQALGELCEVVPVSDGARKGFGPGWWQALQFAFKANVALLAHPGALSISLERGPKAHVYRAGDGVHKRWRELAGGMSFNPLHVVAPWLEEQSLRAARIVIANSKMVAEELRRYYPWVGPKVRVVYNGYNPQKFFVTQTPKAEIRAQLGLPIEGTLLLFAGSGWARKGLKQALSIAGLCKDTQPTLVVVGKGNPRELVGHKAIYKGVVDNMAAYYQACDALVLPTLYDPFSNVVLEALACGLPVVTTRNNGASEVLREGVTGFVMHHPDRDHKDAAYWLDTHMGIAPQTVAETVQLWTLEHEVGAIRKILVEVDQIGRKLVRQKEVEV